MSGGSFDYLGLCTEYLEALGKPTDLNEMADALEEIAPDHVATRMTRWLSSVTSGTPLPMTLAAVWKAVEWHHSGDWSFESVEMALENAEGLDKDMTCFACQASLAERRVTLGGAAVVDLRHAYRELRLRDRSVILADETQDLVARKEGRKKAATYQALQSLQYFGLLVKAFDESGRRIAGGWSITPKGVWFVEGSHEVYEHAIVFRNEVVRYEGNLIGIESVPWLETTAAEMRAEYHTHFPHLEQGETP